MTIVDVRAAKTTARVSCAHCCVCTELYNMISCSPSYLQHHLSDCFRSQEPTDGSGRTGGSCPWVGDVLLPLRVGPEARQPGQLARRGGSHLCAVQEAWDGLAMYVGRVS